MKQLVTSCMLVTCCLLGGCSYYGTDTYLIPSNEDAILHCSQAEVTVGRIMTAQDIKGYAVAGIPYFPAIVPSTPPHLGRLSISLRNVPSTTKCTSSDLYLTDGVSQIRRFPIDVWQSMPVEGGQGNFLSCNYEFGMQVDDNRPYSISFGKDFLGCALPEVPLAVKTDNGYHQVLAQ